MISLSDEGFLFGKYKNMKCDSCKKEIELEVKYCPYCGTSTKKTIKKAVPKKVKRPLILTVLAITIILAGLEATIGVFYFPYSYYDLDITYYISLFINNILAPLVFISSGILMWKGSKIGRTLLVVFLPIHLVYNFFLVHWFLGYHIRHQRYFIIIMMIISALVITSLFSKSSNKYLNKQ